MFNDQFSNRSTSIVPSEKYLDEKYDYDAESEKYRLSSLENSECFSDKDPLRISS